MKQEPKRIQFHHKRQQEVRYFGFDKVFLIVCAKGGTTIALQVPTIEQFASFEVYPKDHWGSYPSIELEFGIAKCSSEDNYNKKLGRKITMGRIDTVGFWVRKYSENEIILCDLNYKYPELVLRKSPNGDKVYFIGTVK